MIYRVPLSKLLVYMVHGHISWTKKYRLIWKIIRIDYLKAFLGSLTRKSDACIMHEGAGYICAGQII